MGAGRTAEEHVAEHLLGDAGIGGVPDEVRTELALPEAAERHVGTQDVAFRAVRVRDRVQRHMGVGGLDAVGELDVGELRPPDHPLLLLGAQRVPRRQIVEVLLHDDVAAAREIRVLGADQRSRPRIIAHRVLGAVDEAQQIPVVEVAEPVRLVDDLHRTAEPVEQLGGPLVAHVHPLGPDVEQQIARGRGGVVAGPVQLLEGMERGRPRTREQPAPRIGTEPGHTGQPGAGKAEPDGAGEGRQIRQRLADHGLTAGFDRGYQDQGRAGQRRDDGLRRCRVLGGLGHPAAP